MAMLAEPRRKQKWTLNPRGKQWSEDSNKFGQKMLEKMGWSNGKGLGANEQGMTEHVKVSYKNNQSGIGFKDTNDQWTQHQADFNEFLSQLQEQNSNNETTATVTPDRDESLELKSKQSKARVHYHKFTRGKDVKKYSSKDLANIFGKKELGDAKQLSKAEDPAEEVVEEPTGSKDTTGGVLTVKGGNIDEYFRNKLPNFVKKRNSNVQVERDDSDGEFQPHFGLGFSSVKGREECLPSEKEGETVGEDGGSTSGFAFANEGLDLEYSEEGSEPKKRKVDFAYDNPCLNLENGKKPVEKCSVPFSREGFVNPALNLTEPTNDANIGAEFEVSRVEFGVVNDALDLSDEEGKKKRVTFNDKLEYSTDVVKRKKGKAKAKLDKFEVESNDKLKKKSKESVAVNNLVAGSEIAGFVNEALDVEVISEEINDNELNERKTKKAKRKKKNRRKSNLETIEEAAEEGSVIYQSEVGEAVLLDDGSPEKKTKLEKSFNTNSEVEVEATIDSLDGRCEEERRVRKKEKKSKKKCAEIETEQEIVILEELVAVDKPKKRKHELENERPEVSVEKEITKKKKKNKRKKIDESTEVGDDEAQMDNDPELEVSESTEGKKKSKKKSKAKFDENNCAVLSSSLEADIQLATTNTGSGAKRKSSDTDVAEKSTKKSKVEDVENVEQNEDTSVNSATSNLRNKKGRTPKKIFKSLFSKAPTLYFSGANINEMAGYGADFRNSIK